MPVVVVATLTVKPESVDTVRDILTTAAEEVHAEPGCQLYSVNQSGETFVFVEQWADEDALKTLIRTAVALNPSRIRQLIW